MEYRQDKYGNRLSALGFGCMCFQRGVTGIDMAAYNRRYAEGKASGFFDYMMCTALRKNATPASNCVGCGKCEQHCPQHLPIRRHLKEAKNELEGPLYRLIRRVTGWFVHF